MMITQCHGEVNTDPDEEREQRQNKHGEVAILALYQSRPMRYLQHGNLTLKFLCLSKPAQFSRLCSCSTIFDHFLRPCPKLLSLQFTASCTCVIYESSETSRIMVSNMVDLWAPRQHFHPLCTAQRAGRSWKRYGVAIRFLSIQMLGLLIWNPADATWYGAERKESTQENLVIYCSIVQCELFVGKHMVKAAHIWYGMSIFFHCRLENGIIVRLHVCFGWISWQSAKADKKGRFVRFVLHDEQCPEIWGIFHFSS